MECTFFELSRYSGSLLRNSQVIESTNLDHLQMSRLNKNMHVAFVRVCIILRRRRLLGISDGRTVIAAEPVDKIQNWK